MSGSGVSVVMPLFNKAAHVSRSVRSILGQTHRQFELVVVNDGSTDDGRDVVASIGDRRIRVIDQGNAGVSAARNRGVDEAREELIAFCDADDEWEPDHLASILELSAEHPAADVCATGYFVADAGGRRRANVLRGLPGGFEQGYLESYFRVAAASDPPLHTSSVAVSRQALRAVGMFPEGVHSGEDLLTWARLALGFRIAYRRRPSATFMAPGRVTDRPGRVPARPDVVGDELARLRAKAPDPIAGEIAAYLALWCRMRGVIYLKLGRGGLAREEFRRSLRYGGWSPKVGLLWLLGLTPRPGAVLEFLESRRSAVRHLRR